MATQDEQMNMLMQQGGMQDDGMTRDPVSGNEVPPGSLAKEVRDDIPAQLSEGEYVIPADAVQFHGLKFYEATVQEAKMGLADMNARGRIGGEPVPQEQTPQALPFDISELQTRESAPQQPMPIGVIKYLHNEAHGYIKKRLGPNKTTTYKIGRK